MNRLHRLGFTAVALFVFGWTVYAADPDLSEYRTADKAITTTITKGAKAIAPRAGFLGVSVATNGQGKLAIAEVSAESPSAKAGVQRGDVVLSFDGKVTPDEDTFYDLLRSKTVGSAVNLALSRQNRRLDVSARLEALSRSLTPEVQRAALGARVVTVSDGQGVKIEQVETGSAADRARLKVGEVILKIDDATIPNPQKLTDVIAGRKPNDTVTLTLLIAEKQVEMKVQLDAERVAGQPAGGGGAGGGRGGFGRGRGYWTRPTYKLGIILIDYPDQKHNAVITPKAWEDSMFSHDKAYTKSSTGQTAYGSMYDYYVEQSFGKLKIEGKAFEHVTVTKKKSEYAGTDSGGGGGGGGGGGRGGGGMSRALLTEAMNLILKRDGADAFKGLDGVFFIYSGVRPNGTPRGSLYWPHRASVNFNGESWPYFICPEGGERMTDISVFCHEFGHMLSLPDLYARPENPGMEGSGVWSAMANQVGQGHPQQFCAWCKEKLQWVTPAILDPTVKQKLILAPIEDSPKECYKVLLQRDGSEYFLLENRANKGFDRFLPAHGLIIWRVVGNRPTLEESHGIEGPRGPGSFQNFVPFPSPCNDSFTPFTTPSSRSQLGPGGLPVYITNITRQADGRITFQIGYEYH